MLAASLAALMAAANLAFLAPPAATSAAAADDTPTITVSDSKVTAGKRVIVSGQGPSRRLVVLQMRSAENGWQKVAGTRTGPDGAYSFRAPDWYGTHWLRVVAPPTLEFEAAVSDTRTVTVTMPYRPKGRPWDWTWISHRGARWEPCRTITYRVNPRGGYDRATADIRSTVRKVSHATGFRFRYLGTTSHAVTRGRYGTHPAGTDVIIDWQSARQDRDLSGRVAGMGGHWVQDGRRFDGWVVLDRRERMSRATWRQVMMHEFGHVIGLGHTRPEAQVMSRGTTTSDNRWGAGDLAGMRRIGASRGCLG